MARDIEHERNMTKGLQLLVRVQARANAERIETAIRQLDHELAAGLALCERLLLPQAAVPAERNSPLE